jgi:hypothetical protein
MGQVCQRHQEFYEDECRYCEPAAAMPLESCDSAHARLTRLPGGGRCERCRYDILPVAFVRPQFKQIPSYAELLGAEVIGPGESKFWMDFINTKYCKADPAEQWPPGGVTGSGL